MTSGFVLVRDKRVNVANVDYYEPFNYTSTVTGLIVYTVRIMYTCYERHTFKFTTEKLRDDFLDELDKLLGVDPTMKTL